MSLVGFLIVPFIPFFYIPRVQNKYIPYPDIRRKANISAVLGAAIGMVYILFVIYKEGTVNGDDFAGAWVLVMPYVAGLTGLSAYCFAAIHLLQRKLGGNVLFSSIFIGAITSIFIFAGYSLLQAI